MPTGSSRCFSNLLSNSLKFTQNGFITLAVKAIYEQKNGNPTLKFSVRDSGIGIKDSDQPKLFKLFSKLDQNDRDINRTGVGLWSHDFSKPCEAAGSENGERGIGIESEEGKGSKFWFFVTSKEDEEGKMCSLGLKAWRLDCLLLRPIHLTQTLHWIIVALWRRTSLKALEISDPKITFLWSFYLSPSPKRRYWSWMTIWSTWWSLKSTWNSSGSNTWQQITARKPLKRSRLISSKRKDSIILILMDCNMPILDGFQASRKILKFLHDEGLPEIPIIAVTSECGGSWPGNVLSGWNEEKFLTETCQTQGFGSRSSKLPED